MLLPGSLKAQKAYYQEDNGDDAKHDGPRDRQGMRARQNDKLKRGKHHAEYETQVTKQDADVHRMWRFRSNEKKISYHYRRRGSNAEQEN